MGDVVGPSSVQVGRGKEERLGLANVMWLVRCGEGGKEEGLGVGRRYVVNSVRGRREKGRGWGFGDVVWTSTRGRGWIHDSAHAKGASSQGGRSACSIFVRLGGRDDEGKADR